MNTQLGMEARAKKKKMAAKACGVPFSRSWVLPAPASHQKEVERNDRLVNQLYAAIRALPPAKRALVVLYLDGFPCRHGDYPMWWAFLASNVGVSLNRIKKDLAAAVKDDGQ